MKTYLRPLADLPARSAACVQGASALFAVRQPVRNRTGKVIGCQDMPEVFRGRDGALHAGGQIVAVGLSLPLWDAFAAAAIDVGIVLDPDWRASTICDRDFCVERTRTGYIVTASRMTPDHRPGTKSWQRYTDALELKGLSVVQAPCYRVDQPPAGQPTALRGTLTTNTQQIPSLAG